MPKLRTDVLELENTENVSPVSDSSFSHSVNMYPDLTCLFQLAVYTLQSEHEEAVEKVRLKETNE